MLTADTRDAAAPGRVPALAAALLAFASAAVSLFWTLGGTLLLDTVGGAIESWFVAWGLALAWAARSAWQARKGS